jgi:hypothetical protein
MNCIFSSKASVLVLTGFNMAAFFVLGNPWFGQHDQAGIERLVFGALGMGVSAVMGLALCKAADCAREQDESCCNKDA